MNSKSLKRRNLSFLAAAAALLVSSLPALAAGEMIDLTRAVVIAPKGAGQEQKAVALLLDEVEKRSQLRWEKAERWPAEKVPVIAVGRPAALQEVADARVPGTAAGGRAEGYRVQIDRSGAAPVVWVVGNDTRGVLFGVGHLLRKLSLQRQKITAPADLQADTAPQTPLRGHQLGYRPKTNSYDGWTVALWEQYLRDLAVFGCNAIELIPPRSDDARDSPHFPLPQMPMMVEMSRLANEYGLDVWIWYPALDKDYSDP